MNLAVNFFGSETSYVLYIVVNSAQYWDVYHPHPLWTEWYKQTTQSTTQPIHVYCNAYKNIEAGANWPKFCRWKWSNWDMCKMVNENKSWMHHRLYDVMKWKHFPRYGPFCAGKSLVTGEFPSKGQRRRALMFSLICVSTNGRVNNRDADYLRRRRAYYAMVNARYSNCDSKYNAFFREQLFISGSECKAGNLTNIDWLRRFLMKRLFRGKSMYLENVSGTGKTRQSKENDGFHF